MKKAIQLLAIAAVLVGFSACANYQGPLRENDAYKRQKQQQRELKRNMGHNRMSG